MNFIIRWLVTAIAVGVAVWIVPGMDLLGGTDAWVGIAIFGLILSLINISIKPIMQVLSLPISAVNTDVSGQFCYVVENGAAVRRDVKTGLSSDTQVEIGSVIEVTFHDTTVLD